MIMTRAAIQYFIKKVGKFSLIFSLSFPLFFFLSHSYTRKTSETRNVFLTRSVFCYLQYGPKQSIFMEHKLFARTVIPCCVSMKMYSYIRLIDNYNKPLVTRLIDTAFVVLLDIWYNVETSRFSAYAWYRNIMLIWTAEERIFLYS